MPQTYGVSETSGTATIRVTLSRAVASTVTVDYATSDDSATSSGDYTAASGALTFDPGDVEKTFTVSLIDDGDAEADESLDLVLSEPTNALLGWRSTAQLIIVDDATTTDTIVTFEATDPAAYETQPADPYSDPPGNFTIGRDHRSLYTSLCL